MRLTRSFINSTFRSMLVVAALTLSGLTTAAFADEVKIDVSAANALHAALEKLVGKSVALRLHSGEEVAGMLEAVGPDSVRVGQLTGKEFYAAVIRIEGIDGVVYRNK